MGEQHSGPHPGLPCPNGVGGRHRNEGLSTACGPCSRPGAMTFHHLLWFHKHPSPIPIRSCQASTPPIQFLGGAGLTSAHLFQPLGHPPILGPLPQLQVAEFQSVLRGHRKGLGSQHPGVVRLCLAGGRTCVSPASGSRRSESTGEGGWERREGVDWGWGKAGPLSP